MKVPHNLLRAQDTKLNPSNLPQLSCGVFCSHCSLFSFSAGQTTLGRSKKLKAEEKKTIGLAEEVRLTRSN
ncbi:hypothetical protein PROFUN_10659 [Planoprotostelium fungivorum]|uniref:Uncharacterized protein n=1 Tax=Planoprotostelium fungivorum TaxID=1890364 RepID=A0A2P6MUT4_9EUKA|nr:hypothetical protein PROFUN_10659 [Planoprotostelium fungivorum]